MDSRHGTFCEPGGPVSVSCGLLGWCLGETQRRLVEIGVRRCGRRCVAWLHGRDAVGCNLSGKGGQHLGGLGEFAGELGTGHRRQLGGPATLVEGDGGQAQLVGGLAAGSRGLRFAPAAPGVGTFMGATSYWVGYTYRRLETFRTTVTTES
jgi:hypothetical protein